MTNPSADPTLADRFRAHARALADGGRSPLYAELMTAAADDLEQGGVVARLFRGAARAPVAITAHRWSGTRQPRRPADTSA